MRPPPSNSDPDSLRSSVYPPSCLLVSPRQYYLYFIHVKICEKTTITQKSAALVSRIEKHESSAEIEQKYSPSAILLIKMGQTLSEPITTKETTSIKSSSASIPVRIFSSTRLNVLLGTHVTYVKF